MRGWVMIVMLAGCALAHERGGPETPLDGSSGTIDGASAATACIDLTTNGRVPFIPVGDRDHCDPNACQMAYQALAQTGEAAASACGYNGCGSGSNCYMGDAGLVCYCYGPLGSCREHTGWVCQGAVPYVYPHDHCDPPCLREETPPHACAPVTLAIPLPIRPIPACDETARHLCRLHLQSIAPPGTHAVATCVVRLVDAVCGGGDSCTLDAAGQPTCTCGGSPCARTDVCVSRTDAGTPRCEPACWWPRPA